MAAVTVTKDMTIGEILNIDIAIAPILMQAGMREGNLLEPSCGRQACTASAALLLRVNLWKKLLWFTAWIVMVC